MSTKSMIVLATLASGLTAGLAQAHGDDTLRWSVTVGAPAAVPYYAPAPVYVRPAPPPQRHGRAFYQPTRWDVDGDGIPNRYDRVYNPPWDRDGDGIPNRVDHRYNPSWDRDGDGIPNRRDPVYNPRWDRDGDGIPNRQDPRPRMPDRGWGR
jgi:hypothetical protein